MGSHPGPRIDKIPVAGVGGAIFTVGMVAIFLIGAPFTRAFIAASLLAGVAVGVILYRRSR